LGPGGFVGKHLITELLCHGSEIIAFDREFPLKPEGVKEVVTGDLLDSQRMLDVVASTKPDSCVHLAGISFAPSGRKNASDMFSINIVGTINLLDAFRNQSAGARILFASTAHVYAGIHTPGPIHEDTPLVPLSFYAISKAAADLTTLEYCRQHGMQTMTARPNNHIGPGQSPLFVIASLAQQLKKIAATDSRGTLHVGNMESIRDFTDVRDVVAAYRLLLEKGKPGRAYNISSNKMLKITDVFDELCRLAGVKPQVVVDNDRFRPTDCSPVLDTSRILEDTGWTPDIQLPKTLEDILAGF